MIASRAQPSAIQTAYCVKNIEPSPLRNRSRGNENVEKRPSIPRPRDKTSHFAACRIRGVWHKASMSRIAGDSTIRARYLPALTGLRGIAAAWVLGFHLYQYSGSPDLG